MFRAAAEIVYERIRHTPGVLHGCERKGVAGRGVCNDMKKKAREMGGDRGGRREVEFHKAL